MDTLEKVGHMFGRVREMLSSVNGWLLMIGSMLLSLPDPVKSFIALVVIWGIDLVTGSYASVLEARREGKEVKVYLIESEKLRESIVKGTGYLQWIFYSWLITSMFFDQKITLTHSTKAFTVVELTLGVCIAVEIWSNVENSKRMGFDVVAKISDILKALWKIIRTVKSGE